jgi:ketosteroid isomerase-like protein
MPTVLDLTIPASPPKPTLQKGQGPDANYVGLVPIELSNGCIEEGCSIESDDTKLTNAVRRHFLEHFGHRNLDGIAADYAENAIMVQVLNGERKSYHGRDEVRIAFQEIFKLHPTVDSTFHLKHIVVHDRNAMVVWSAATPTHIFPQSSDNMLFDTKGKILKHFCSCQINDVYKDKPWYVEDE